MHPQVIEAEEGAGEEGAEEMPEGHAGEDIRWIVLMRLDARPDQEPEAEPGAGRPSAVREGAERSERPRRGGLANA
jgi:hypothetical protein